MQLKSINDLDYIEITNKAATAKIALQGAHLFHYQRVGEEPLLWLSEVSEFERGKAIRGGVPICWPSFGDNNPDLPQHGFARVMMWQFDSLIEIDEYTTQISFSLQDSEESHFLWDYKFHVKLVITVGKTLQLELITTNLDTKPFTLSQAFHTYFSVSSIDDVIIRGLEDKEYLDALTLKTELQKDDITFNQEVDRVYQGVASEIILQDAKRKIFINNSGSKSVVVWNPWIEKCARMSAMQSDAYKEFVCIESANAYDDKRELLPQKAHTLETIII
ncbi:D-hexose-6-phosphate mutarotase [Sulfurimonas sp.]|uniref:D-hexose-6-phosphate mutarotase n=1 Tax=Sulfurimonas sp. TaxID=2022749 RepID=UPI003D145E75